MPTYHLTQSELVSLFRSRAKIARDALARDPTPTRVKEASFKAEAATWESAAQILSDTLLTPPFEPL